MRPFKQYFILILSVVLSITMLSGCSESNTSGPSQTLSPATTVHQTMIWILDPAADLVWGSAGTVITEAGEKDLSPTTDEEWENVVRSAAIIAESGNLLMMHGRSYNPDWLEYSQGLSTAGTLALKAAQAKDSDALFNAGGRIYQVCKACHSQFLIETD